MKLYDDPAFNHLDPQLVARLQQMIDTSAKKRNPMESLQGMFAVDKELSKSQITCTPAMQVALLNAFKDTLPKAQRKQFESFFKMLIQQNRSS